MNLRKGSKVWAEDRDSAWVAAEVADFAGKQVRVATAAGKKVICCGLCILLGLGLLVFGWDMRGAEFLSCARVCFCVGLGFAGEAASSGRG